jgi:hypothetical protein
MRIKRLLIAIACVAMLVYPARMLADYTCSACLAEASDQGAAAYENCMNTVGDDALCQQQMWWAACQYGQGHCSPCQGTVDMCGRVGGRGPTLP